MEVNIIVCVNNKNCIGKDNNLLCYLPSDLKNFKKITSGNVVIMGRKTFESLGSKPLPKRKNIVITRSDVEFEGVFTAHSLEEAVSMAEGDEEIFIMGGAQIYAQSLDIADRMYITRVERDYEGDTSFPEIDYSKWTLVKEERFERGEEYESPFAFLVYDKK